MKTIKLFLYLDQEKIISLSSQIFDGVIESFLDRKETKKTDGTDQKGPFGSGHLLKDSNESIKETIEKKILNDHIFSIFEKEMFTQDKVLCISKDQPLNKEITPLQFVKITGQATFFDANVVIKLLDDFNSLGESFAYIQLMDTFTNKAEIKSKIKKFIADNNYHLDNDFIKNLKGLLIQSYKNSLEVEIPIDDYLYTAILNRDFLRENEELLVGKLSRRTEAKITIFGITTQVKTSHDDYDDYLDAPIDTASFKSISKNLIYPILEMEKSFSGKSPNEIKINPLAIYLELN